MATSTLRLSPTEVGEIVRNYLTQNGYKVEKVSFDVGNVASGHPMQEQTTPKFTGASVDLSISLPLGDKVK